MRLLLHALLLTLPLHAQSPTPAESAVLTLTNQVRAAHHLAPLTWDPALTRAARLHVAWLLGDPGPLEHQYPGEPSLIARASSAGAHFESVSENLARRAQTPRQLTDTWMASPVHRANILDPHLTSIGIAVVQFQGLLYAVQDFSRSTPNLSPASVEQHVAQLLRTRGIPSAGPSEAARLACTRNAQDSPGASLVVHWEASDLSQLPDVVLQQIARNHFRSAAVGACPSRNPQNRGFTTFNVALLLY